MTEAAILFAIALAMVAIWIIAKAGHAQQLRETAERQYLAGYQDAILGKEQADPIERIIRTATTKKEPQ